MEGKMARAIAITTETAETIVDAAVICGFLLAIYFGAALISGAA
jgi:hypothetical protein